MLKRTHLINVRQNKNRFNLIVILALNGLFAQHSIAAQPFRIKGFLPIPASSYGHTAEPASTYGHTPGSSGGYGHSARAEGEETLNDLIRRKGGKGDIGWWLVRIWSANGEITAFERVKGVEGLYRINIKNDRDFRTRKSWVVYSFRHTAERLKDLQRGNGVNWTTRTKAQLEYLDHFTEEQLQQMEIAGIAPQSKFRF